MRLFIKARTGQKEDKVVPPPPRLIPDDEEWYSVSVKERPIEGKANEAITRLLAAHFKVSRSEVKLISGAVSKRKVFEIKGLEKESA